MTSTSRRSRMLLAVLGMAVLAGPARAQTAFGGGGYFGDVKRFSGEPGTSVLDTTGNGAWVAAGSRIAATWSLRAEVGVSAETSTTRSVDVVVGGVQPITVGTSYSSQFTTVSMLLGAGGPSGTARAGLTWLGGVMFARVRRTSVIQTGFSLAGSVPPPAPSVTLDYVAGPVVGADAAVRLTRRLVLTAGVRAAALRLSGDLGGITIRPSAGLLYGF